MPRYLVDSVTLIPQLAKKRCKILSSFLRPLPLRLHSRPSSQVRKPMRFWPWVAKCPSARLCGREGGFCSLGNQPRLILSYSAQDVNREPVCKRNISRDEINIAFQKLRDHSNASS